MQTHSSLSAVEVTLVPEAQSVTERVIRYLAGADGFDEPPKDEQAEERAIVPAFDVEVRPHRYLITVTLPNFQMDDVTVAVASNQVLIYGRHAKDRDVTASEGGACTLTFSKAFRLPNWIDVDSAEATFGNGVLSVAFLRTMQYGLRYVTVKNVSHVDE